MHLVLLALSAAFYPTLFAAVVILLSQPRRLALMSAYLAGGLTISIGLGLAIVAALKALPGASYLIALKDIAAGHHSTGLDIFQVLIFNLIMFPARGAPVARPHPRARTHRRARGTHGSLVFGERPPDRDGRGHAARRVSDRSRHRPFMITWRGLRFMEVSCLVHLG